MGEELLITVKEAGRRLGLGRSATWVLIQRGVLPSVKVGGARRVLVADLQEFVSLLKERDDESS
ncbi:MAG: helix-turn-helix domain-containing protein [Dehalococcoidia bacterium]